MVTAENVPRRLKPFHSSTSCMTASNRAGGGGASVSVERCSLGTLNYSACAYTCTTGPLHLWGLFLQIRTKHREHLGIPQTQALAFFLSTFRKLYSVTTICTCIYTAFGISDNTQNKAHREIKHELHENIMKVLNIHRF